MLHVGQPATTGGEVSDTGAAWARSAGAQRPRAARTRARSARSGRKFRILSTKKQRFIANGLRPRAARACCARALRAGAARLVTSRQHTAENQPLFDSHESHHTNTQVSYAHNARLKEQPQHLFANKSRTALNRERQCPSLSFVRRAGLRPPSSPASGATTPWPIHFLCNALGVGSAVFLFEHTATTTAEIKLLARIVPLVANED
mgnify:CR=1 FL=1